MDKGKLYIVSTPIGNMSDITLRAIEVLKSADYIVAEDTREAGKLLMLLNLPKKQLISYRDQIHDRALPGITKLLNNGQNIALISDRGTPLISDPGFKLVRDLKANGYNIEVVPGPSAVLAALTLSGLPTDRFAFLGFLPRSAGKQKKILSEYAEIPVTLILFESPFRLLKTLESVKKVFEEVQVAAINELTKIHEKVISGNISVVIEDLKITEIKGEWVIVIRKL